MSDVFDPPKNDTLAQFMQQKEQDFTSLFFGICVFYIATPSAIAWCITKLVRKIRHRPDVLVQEQKYALYIMFLFQTFDMLAALAETATIHAGSFTKDHCYAFHTYYSFSFNIHLLTLMFYLYFFHKGIEDPLVNSLCREITVYLFLPLFAFGLSWDSGVLKCMHLETVLKRTYVMRSHSGLVHAIVFTFLPVIALPILQYMRLSIKEASTGLVEAAMRLHQRYLNYLVLFVSMQVLFHLVMSLVAMFVPYERDILIIRILMQLMTFLVYYSVTQYITFRSPRAEQVADEETAEHEIETDDSNSFDKCCLALGLACERAWASIPCSTWFEERKPEENDDDLVVPNKTDGDELGDKEGDPDANEDDDQIRERLGEDIGAGPTGEEFRSESDVHDAWRRDFKGNFGDGQLARRTTL